MDATTTNNPEHEPQINDPQPSPKVGSQNEAPRAAVESIRTILNRARQGDKSVLPQLQQVLERNPRIWRVCHDLVAMSEEAWLERLSAGEPLLILSLRRQVEQLKLDLVGPSPTPLEKLLGDRIVSAWLAVHDAEMCEASRESSGFKLAAMRLKRLESANKRFHAAIKSLAVARRLTNGLKIEITHNHEQPVANNGGGTTVPSDPGEAGQPAAVHDRLKGFLKEGTAPIECAAAGVNV